jgi:hypothetical protein
MSEPLTEPVTPERPEDSFRAGDVIYRGTTRLLIVKINHAQNSIAVVPITKDDRRRYCGRWPMDSWSGPLYDAGYTKEKVKKP